MTVSDAWRLVEGDCVQVMAGMPEACVDAVVCDPPYGLEFMGKSWDRLSDDAVARSWDTRGRTMTGAPQRDTATPGGRSGASLYRKDNPRCDNCGRAINGRATVKGFKVCECDTPAPRLTGASGRKMQEWHERWAREALRVLKPGGFLLAFGGTRTYHRLACAVEDAGFEIRDRVLALGSEDGEATWRALDGELDWLYGSGFPKSLDVSKAIDKRAQENDETTRRIAAVAAVIREYRERAGMERAEVSEVVVGTPSGACWNWEHHQLPSVEMWPRIKATLGIPDEFDGLIVGDRARFIAAERAVIALRSVPRGHAFAGPTYGGDSSAIQAAETAPGTPEAERWEGWGTALKPAHEPIVVARKPLAGTVAGNVLAHGVGAMNIDGCRIEGVVPQVTQGAEDRVYGNGRGLRSEPMQSQPHAAGRWPANVVLVHSELCRRVGTRRVKSGNAPPNRDESSTNTYGWAEGGGLWKSGQRHGDVDGMEEVEAWECADGCPVKALDAQSGQSVSQGGTGGFGSGAARRHEGWTRPSHADGYSYTPGYGDSGGASRFFYTAKASSAERNAGLPTRRVLRLREDLTDEQVAYVMRRLEEHRATH